MSRLVLATADTDFEQRVRDAFEGELDGPLRYWREDMLVDPATRCASSEDRGVEVVALGPDMHRRARLALADRVRPRPARHQRRDRGASRRPTSCRSALHAGARDVIAPDMRARRPAGGDRAGVLDTADAPPPGVRRRRRRRGDDDRGRVIMALCPKGGAGKTTMSTNLALGAGPGRAGRGRDPRPRPAVRRRRERARPAPDAHVRRRGRARSTRSTPPALKAHLTVARAGPLRALRAARRPPRPTTSRSSRSSEVLSCSSQSFKYVVIDTASGLDEYTLAALEYATDLCSSRPPTSRASGATVKEIEALRVDRQAAAPLALRAQPRRRQDRAHHPRDRADRRHQRRRRDPELALGAAVAEPGRCRRRCPTRGRRSRWRCRSSCAASRRRRRRPTPARTAHLRRRAVTPMKLSERMKQSRSDDAEQAHVRDRQPRGADGAAEAKAATPTTRSPSSSAAPRRRCSSAWARRCGTRRRRRRSSTRRSCASSARVLKEEKIPLNDAERDQLVSEIIDQALGYGPIERYLDDPSVSEVMVNGLDGVYVERDGKLERDRRAVLLRAARPAGDRPHRRAARPPHRRGVADGRRPLPDGSRVNAVIPPLAVDGPQLTIRKFAQRVLHPRRPRAPRHAHRPGRRRSSPRASGVA